MHEGSSLPEITFYLKDLSVGQGKHLITKRIFLSCELLSFPLKPRRLSQSLAQGSIEASTALLTLESHMSLELLYVQN